MRLQDISHDDTLKITYADGIVYTCQNSGECCKNDWIIGIDDESYQKIKDTDWKSMDSSLGDEPYFVPVTREIAFGEKLTFARNQCNACVFMNPQNLCSIHQHLGFDTKPQVCKEFPYYFVHTPEGVSVGLSFACKAVRSFQGIPLKENPDEIKKVLANSYRIRQIPDEIELYGPMILDWDEYKSLETALMDLLSFKGRPIQESLMAGNIIASMIAISLKQVENQAKQQNKEPQETLRGGLNKIRDNKYQAVYKIVEKIKKPARVSYTYLTLPYTWMEFSRSDLNRFSLLFSIYRNYFKFRKGRGVIKDLWSGQGTLDLEQVTQLPIDYKSPHLQDFLKAYWSHVIFRKNLLPVFGVFRGFQILVMMYGFMAFSARCYAIKKGKTMADLEDFQDAVKVVEQRFILHSQFPKIFTMSRLLTTMTDQMCMKKDFVPSIVL